jgi:hypothetical protein
VIGRAVAGVTALSCAAVAVWLAAHHPLSAPLAVAMTLLAGAAVARWPWIWPVMVPALLPLLALAPWSGWISVEEMDLLVLAVAAGGYGRWALRPQPHRSGIDVGAALALLLLALWTVSVVISLMRGITDAGGLTLDWYQAYRGPMNALRLAKPTLAVWLLLPLWLRLEATPDARATDRLTLGLALCHAAAALSCLYERLAYTGLLNFSADYRTTGLFWEMHIGGAGLDACLAMTFPFAWRLWAKAQSRWASVLSLALLLLGVYAVLTTFSRILLLAVPLGIVVMLWMQRHRGTAAPTSSSSATASRRQLLTFGMLCLAIGLAAAWLFVGAGYRGLAALLGSSALLLMLAPKAARLQAREWALAVALALVFGPLWLALAWWLPKGPYVAFALILAMSLATAMGLLRLPSPTALAVGGYWVAVACLGLVAWHWGGERGLHTAWPAIALLALALPLVATLWPDPWPDHLRWQAGAWTLLGAIAMVIALFGGGSYMSGRVSASDGDRQDRLHHWQTALSMIDSEEARWLGIGLGRFLDRYAVTASVGQRPGDLRLVENEGAQAMNLATGTHLQDWGTVLRLSQRIARPQQGPVTVRMVVRGAPGTTLHAEICVKHLLYDHGCQFGKAALPPADTATGSAASPTQGATSPGPWQTLTYELQDSPLPTDPWYLPRITVFSLASENALHGLALREVSVVDGRGVELITNGRFQQAGAHWFFSSDRNHLPWHAKSLTVHLLVEQGWLGLASLGLMTLAALAVSIGRVRRLPLAPALAAGLAGAWAVGLIDSLIDMPRIALLLLLLTTIAIAQRPRSARSRSA